MERKERRKYMRQAMKFAQQVMFDEVYARYVPLYEKAFAEEMTMKGPENMEARMKELIEEQEGRFDMLRQALKAYEEAKKNGTLDKEDEEDDDDEDEEPPAERRFDTWLKDWSENVRTNTTIETCASF
ncbi:MAG: hypothetical protein IJI73_04845, partial [Kiritimatiellae bacterium]|nr:hypothetical protein [Kiritimatiellia bacterium]